MENDWVPKYSMVGVFLKCWDEILGTGTPPLWGGLRWPLPIKPSYISIERSWDGHSGSVSVYQKFVLYRFLCEFKVMGSHVFFLKNKRYKNKCQLCPIEKAWCERRIHSIIMQLCSLILFWPWTWLVVLCLLSTSRLKKYQRSSIFFKNQWEHEK